MKQDIYDEYVEYKEKLEALISGSPHIESYDASQLAIIIVFLRSKQTGYAKGLKKGEDLSVLRTRASQLWRKAVAEGFPHAPPQPAAIQSQAVKEYFENKKGMRRRKGREKK